MTLLRAPLPARPRIVLALVVGLIAASVFIGRASGYENPMQVAGDLHTVLEGSRLLSTGEDIFVTRPQVPDAITGTYSAGHYPYPAYLLVRPLVGLPPLVAAAAFVFLSTALLTWLLGGKGDGALLLLASYPMVKEWSLANWSPLIMCAAYSPFAAAFIACKPQVGLPILAALPDRRRLAWCGALAVLSVALWPAWPLEWLGALPHVSGLHVSRPGAAVGYYDVALLLPGGILLLAALARPRDPKAHMLLLAALLPQRPTFDDQMPLFLTAGSMRRKVIWVMLTWLGAGGWLAARAFAPDAEEPLRNAICTGTMWLPALWFVLRPSPERDEAPAPP